MLAVRIATVWLFAAACMMQASTDFLAAGQRAYAAGDLEQARQLFLQHLSIHPNDARAISNLAAVHARREEYPAAVAAYRKAIAVAADVPEIRFNLAVALLKGGETEAAIPELKSFLQARPEELRARHLLGVAYVDSGRFGDAIAELEAVRAASPADPSVVFPLAMAHARGGDESAAQELVSQLERLPAQARLLEGLIEYRFGRFPEARAKLEECLRYDRNQVAAIAALGRLHLLDKQDEAAIELLERAIHLAPHDAESTYQLGVLYDRNGDTTRGMEYLHRAASMRSGYADPHYQLARILHREQQLDEALKAVNVADRLLPDHEAIRFLKGRILQSLGRAGEARVEFDAVRKLKAQTIEKARQRVVSDLTLEP
jgi:Flp pilus assembly protein TadD